MLGRDPVFDALERWERKELLPPEMAARLREEAAEEKDRSGRRASQYALAVAGGIVLLVAFGVLTDWLWPLLGEGLRATAILVVGFLVHALGMRLEYRDRWRPAAYALQTAGLLVVLWAIVYSDRAWDEGSPEALFLGVVALVTPMVAGTVSLRRNPVMPAVQVTLLPAFVAAFLDRALPSASGDTVIWIVDGVMAVVTLALVAELVRALREGHPKDRIDMRLWALTAALYVGLVMMTLTAMLPLDLEAHSLLAADAWWVGMTALTLWAIHRAPLALRRDWYAWLLAVGLLLAVPFVFGTCLEVFDFGAPATALTLALVGAAGIAYALETREMLVLRTSALVVVIAAWYFGVEEAGALGAVGALVFTAVLLFWLSARLGADEERPTDPVT